MSNRREIELLVVALEAGDIDRREFVRRALAMGLAASTAVHWLQACGEGANVSPSDAKEGFLLDPPGTIPPADWLSHPPYRPLPTASSRPFDEGSRAYFIAPGGSDTSGNGSESNPWRSWGMATARLGPGDTLYMRGGVYFMYGKAHWLSSGTATQPMTIRAYPGELPIVTTAHPEFYRDPGTAWEPVPGIHGGVEFEYRSAQTYGLSSPVVTGRFADSYYPLFAYSKETDFRSENEFMIQGLQNRTDLPQGFWAGPGAWWSQADRRIHIRLRHTNRAWLDTEDYLGIGEDFLTNNYKGETDPRNIRLLLIGLRTDQAMVKVDADHIRVFDLVFAANFNLEVDGTGLLLDNIWSCTGDNPALLSLASKIRCTNCKFRGVEAPWNNRFTSKDRSTSPYTVHLIAGTDIEIDHCEITDGHDAVLCTNEMPQNLDFHHNLVERNTDDALFLPPKQASVKRIYQNIFRMNLSHLPFRDGLATAEDVGDGTFICRNLFDMRPMTPGGVRVEGTVEPNEYYDGYNLRMEHADIVTYPGLYFYHNTVLARGSKRTYGQGITERYDDTIRRVFNNIFGQSDRRPQQNIRRANGDLEFGNNLQWSLTMGSGGSWAGDVHADPKFVKWTSEWRDPDDFHLQSESPARGAGAVIPVEWFDPLRDVDPDHDIGAIPFGFTGIVFGPEADL